MQTIIIGSGVAGLASSIRMAVKGHKVTVFEANAYPGGKLSEIQVGAYRFDAGPSLFTMPQYLEDLFALAGKRFADYCPYFRLDTITHYFYPDGTSFRTYADQQRFAEEIRTALGVEPQVVLQHLQRSKKIFDLTSNIFLYQSLHKFQHMSAVDLLRAGANFGALDLFNSMHHTNAKKLRHPKLIQYFDRFATYNGSNPYEAPATLNIIPHLEHNIGAFFPKGGMISITRAMYQLAQELGVAFHFNARVAEITVENKKATGIRLEDGTLHRADLVISNMDVVPTYRKLLPGQKHPEKTLNQPRSSSALIFYWGVRKVFPQLGLHNIFFSADYRKEFDTLFRLETLPEDMTVYVNISSKYEPGDAPEGGENWFVMVNAPNNNGQDWDTLIPQARKHILQKLSEQLQTDIASLIEAEAILEPRTIESRTSSFKGALYGSSSNNKMAAFLRHANFSHSIKGLYFCGGSVHPGGGIPLCLLSAKIVDELIPAR